MPEPTAKEMAQKLLAEGFARTTPELAALTDPIADTPMVVTLDQLRPYDFNPRITRNPRHEEIKASIRERGLDASPAITRRPGTAHFIIRNGGNTRLSVLNELWTETKDERFFRISCLFRPWSPRGEIVALTGHLCENELHGRLTFIERALGIEKARELYEQETSKPLSQRELARRLTADGYPVNHSLVSRMQETVQYLLPAIPNVLYGGLGRPQIERLNALRKAAARCWERHATDKQLSEDFSTLFQDVLALFEGEAEMFHVQRVEDELRGRLSNVLKVPYDTLSLELVDISIQQGEWSPGPAQYALPESNAPVLEPKPVSPTPPASARTRTAPPPPSAPSLETPTPAPADIQTEPAPFEPDEFGDEVELPPDSGERLNAHIVSPAETTERLQAIQRRIADASGDVVPDFKSNVVQAIPVQAGGLYPISDVWYIEPALDVPHQLRIHIAQLATEIAQEADLANRIEGTSNGIGFVCLPSAPRPRAATPSPFQRAVLFMLHALSGAYAINSPPSVNAIPAADPLNDVVTLLLGTPPARRAPPGAHPLSDAGIVKFYRLIRLARRVLELSR